MVSKKYKKAPTFSGVFAFFFHKITVRTETGSQALFTQGYPLRSFPAQIQIRIKTQLLNLHLFAASLLGT